MRRGGKRSGTLPILALLLPLVLGTALSAQRKAELCVPKGRWHVKDGSSSRTRYGVEELRIDELEAVWSRELDGNLATEMLSWDESFYALIRNARGELRLRRFDLEDGALVAETEAMTCKAEPGMAIWGRRIVVTLSGGGVAGFTIGEPGLEPDWRLERKGDLAGPILEGRDLFLREGTRVARYEWQTERPIWESEEGYIGDFALAGEDLLAIREGPEGFFLDALDRESGRRLSRTPLPKLDDRGVGVRPFVQGNGKSAIVRMPGTWTSPSGRTQNTVVLRWPKERSQPLDCEGYIHQSSPPILVDTDLFYLDDVGWEGGGLLMASKQELGTVALKRKNPELFLGGGSLSSTKGHFWCGGSAIRTRDLAIRRLDADERLHSAITALDTLLFRDAAGARVTALREPVASSRVPPALELLDAQVVFAPDGVFEGKVVVDPVTGIVSCQDPKGAVVSRPIARLLVVLDRDHMVRFTPSALALNRGLRASARHDFCNSCLEFATVAARAGLADDLARYLILAQDRGIDVRILEPYYESLRRLREAPPEIESDASEKLLAGEKLHGDKFQDRYWRRMATLVEDDFETGQEALRSWLGGYDEYPPAIEWMRSRIPEGIRPSDDLKPTAWLEFLMAQRRAPVEIVDEMPARKSIPRSREQKALEKAREDWREDLIGVKCGPLFIITPREDPSRIANCLLVGQMVCGELERLFGSSRKTKRLLEIHLFESQEDFVRFGLSKGLGIIGSVAGYYSPRENISRLFVPSEETALYTVLDVLVHELTHHWMESMSPLVPDWKAFRLREGRGSFVVEGLAMMLEELDYDSARVGVQSDPRRYWCLDFVANCPEDRLIPWKKILDGTQLDYARMMVTAEPIRDLEVPTTWHLSSKRKLSTATIYYAQVGALVTYLMQAEEGRHHERLVDLIGRYYRGNTERLDIEKILRLDAEKLGPAIRAWARETVRSSK